MKSPLAVAFVSGLVFAIGLGVSGMTQPGKVIGFLDLFSGAWDPSLAFVMVGAIGVHWPLQRWMRARGMTTSVVGSCGDMGSETLGGSRTLGKLLLGAGVFGVGWGLGGYCPGPAMVSLASFGPGVLVFVAAMLVGMWLLPTESPALSLRAKERVECRLA